MAYDLLSVPAMSAETERSFSGTKHHHTCMDVVEAKEMFAEVV